MRSAISIAPILSPAELEGHRPWLQSFAHDVPANPTGRFHKFSEGDKVLALTQQTALNILAPAVNPNVVSPRQTKEIVAIFHAWSANTPGGLLANVPFSSHMHQRMVKLGYRPVSVLYESI